MWQDLGAAQFRKMVGVGCARRQANNRIGTERLILAPFEVGAFYWLGILRIVLWFTRRPHNAGVMPLVSSNIDLWTIVLVCPIS